MTVQNAPSLKTLRAVVGNEGEPAAKALRAIFKMPYAQLRELPAAAEYRRECSGRPMKYMVRLSALNAAGRFHGIESMESVNGEYAEYLNAGETYTPTIIYWRGRYRVQSMGDFVETMERNGVKFL